MGARRTPSTPDPSRMAVPAVLAQVSVTIDQSGAARVSVDGVEDSHSPVARERLGGLLARIAEQAASPVRVEVREQDGTRYADILTPPPHRAATPQRQRPEKPIRGPLLRADGFTPGETVLVTMPVARIRADKDGRISLQGIAKRRVGLDELVLIGARSRKTKRARKNPNAPGGNGAR